MRLVRPGIFAGTALAIIAASGCGSSANEPAPAGPQPSVLTSLPRPLTSSELNIVGAANAYSFRLWNTINAAQRDTNVFVSPLSASFALGMAMNGAAGQTFDEMRSALQFGGASTASIDSGYKSLIALLTSLDTSTVMQIANAIFYRQGFPFNQSFLTDASTWFEAQVQAQDFSNVAGTLSAVNGWANAKTNGRIPTVLQEVHPDDVMFLLNAIYFKGSWRDKFDPAKTISAPFRPSTGADQSAKLMS